MSDEMKHLTSSIDSQMDKILSSIADKIPFAKAKDNHLCIDITHPIVIG